MSFNYFMIGVKALIEFIISFFRNRKLMYKLKIKKLWHKIKKIDFLECLMEIIKILTIVSVVLLLLFIICYSVYYTKRQYNHLESIYGKDNYVSANRSNGEILIRLRAQEKYDKYILHFQYYDDRTYYKFHGTNETCSICKK